MKVLYTKNSDSDVELYSKLYVEDGLIYEDLLWFSRYSGEWDPIQIKQKAMGTSTVQYKECDWEHILSQHPFVLTKEQYDDTLERALYASIK